MFIFDVETLGKKTDSVVLSMACLYFDPSSKTTPQEMLDNVFFVKFDVENQIKNHGRKIDSGTLDWWSKQSEIARNKSLKRYASDTTLDNGVELMRQWAKPLDIVKNDYVWARGNLDQIILDAIEVDFKLKPVFQYNRWRDVRTAIDFMTGSTNGYCDVEYPNFNSQMIIKHDPVQDCLLDAMMLMYGKSKNE